jgi:DNA-binding NtrC family response regulator
MDKDLFYRIYAYPIRIPPLRERREDIVPLIENYCQEKNWHPSWYDQLVRIFPKGQWIGNIRELHNALERCEILFADRVPEEEELVHLMSSSEQIMAATIYEDNGKTQLEIKRIQDALAKYNGNVTKAIKELNMSRATLYRKLKKYGIEKSF